jgi:hypothetical protein
MALNVLAYNMKRVTAIIGVAGLLGGLGGLSQGLGYSNGRQQKPQGASRAARRMDSRKIAFSARMRRSSARGVDTRPFSHSLGPLPSSVYITTYPQLATLDEY